MGHWIKLTDGTVVSVQEWASIPVTYYDQSSRAWVKATPEMEAEARARMASAGIPDTPPAVPQRKKPLKK